MPGDGFIITLIYCYETYDILYEKQKRLRYDVLAMVRSASCEPGLRINSN